MIVQAKERKLKEGIDNQTITNGSKNSQLQRKKNFFFEMEVLQTSIKQWNNYPQQRWFRYFICDPSAFFIGNLMLLINRKNLKYYRDL